MKTETIWGAATVTDRVAALGARIERRLLAGGDEELLVLTVLGGSTVFTADLIRAIERPIRFEHIHVTYDAGADDRPLAIAFPIPVAVAGERVLLVKDVVDSGVTESYLDAQLRDQGARAVYLAALVDMPEERKVPMAVDFAVFTSPRPGLLVGYGMKHRGRYGNLPAICRLVGSEGGGAGGGGEAGESDISGSG